MSAVAGRTVASATGWSETCLGASSNAPRAAQHEAGLLVVVRWTVSRAALAAVATVGPRGDDPILEWSVSTASASAQLVDGPARRTIFETWGHPTNASADQIRLCVVDQLVHLSVARGGACVLTAVLRRGETRPVLYARTALLAELGIGGGRYEVLDGRVADA